MESVSTKQPNFRVGDVVKITSRDPEDAQKVHTTPFEGIVISQRGEGINKTFTVRKLAEGNVVVERIFPLGSPYIQNIKVIKSTKVRRAKLYYLKHK